MPDSISTHPDPDLERRRTVWRAHIPSHARVVFIGEAPPPEERYFYYPESAGHDHLYLELLQVLYPDLRTRGTAYMRANKRALLRRFADDGYLLIDAVEARIPLSRPSTRKQTISDNQGDLLLRLHLIGHNNFVAIPVKVTVHDGLSKGTKLKIGTHFIHERIPFPSHQKALFRERLGRVLDDLVPGAWPARI